MKRTSWLNLFTVIVIGAETIAVKLVDAAFVARTEQVPATVDTSLPSSIEQLAVPAETISKSTAPEPEPPATTRSNSPTSAVVRLTKLSVACAILFTVMFITAVVIGS